MCVCECSLCDHFVRPFQVERLPPVCRGHAARHLPHVRLPKEVTSSPQEEEEEKDQLARRRVQRRRHDEGEVQRQGPECLLLHGLWEGHPR